MRFTLPRKEGIPFRCAGTLVYHRIRGKQLTFSIADTTRYHSHHQLVKQWKEFIRSVTMLHDMC